MKQIDRRSFIVSATCALGCIGASPAFSQKVIVPKSIVRFGEPAYTSLLDRYFGGISESLGASPFSILITNNSRRPTYAYSICWRYLSPSAGAVHFQRTFAYGPNKHGVSLRFTGKRVLLRSGEVALVTPTHFLPASRYQRRGEPRLAGRSSKLITQANEFMAAIPGGSIAYSSLEAKIGSSTSWGRSPEHIAALYFARRAAEHDVANEMWSIFRSDPTADIYGALFKTQEARGSFAIIPAEASASYVSHRARFISILNRLATFLPVGEMKSAIAKGVSDANSPLAATLSVQQAPWGLNAPASITLA